MDDQELDLYPCVGICMSDPDTGHCLGCGRPPLSTPDIVAERVVPTVQATNPEGGAEQPE